ncbi:unnamed protein product, partial [Musa banksii]
MIKLKNYPRGLVLFWFEELNIPVECQVFSFANKTQRFALHLELHKRFLLSQRGSALLLQELKNFMGNLIFLRNMSL